METSFAASPAITRAVRNGVAQNISACAMISTLSASNMALEVRIQHVFIKVRGGIGRYSLRYDWFKVRTTNGIDTF